MQLTEYPPDIPLNTRRLYLSDNRIRFLPAMTLGLLSDLVYLDCQKNLIQEVMDYTFIGVFKLIYLDLSFNNLSLISPYSFSVLSNLVQLNLSNNPRLLSLNKYTFANTSSLRYLDLRNTGLQTLDHAAFQNLVSLQTLYLSGNPWKCNCSFLDFSIYLIVSHLNHPGLVCSACGSRTLMSIRGPGSPSREDDSVSSWCVCSLGRIEKRYDNDDQNATCVEPTELAGWPIAQVGNPLRYMCITHLDQQDYVFVLLIGFCIFAAGTVAAWLTGVCAVLYQNAHRRSSEDEGEDEYGQRVEVSRRIFQRGMESGHDGFPQLI
ncbi:leucine-rich repeat-containing protein 52-like protein [Camelus ferus]|nr:leucine-rich repeat-containing protein 52-like protein [Camelus ferus]